METAKENPIVLSQMKLKSVGWLLGRCLVFILKVVKTFENNPEYKELAKEGRWFLKRWEVERRIK